MNNPLLQQFQTLHQTFPFSEISLQHIEEAILQGMELEKAEVTSIIENPEKPSFVNTIEALEHSGEVLERATTLMYNLSSAETSDELDELAQRMAPLLATHNVEIMTSEPLFKRIQEVYNNSENLTGEKRRLLECTYENFVRAGALLSTEDKSKLKEIKSELSQLSLRFSQNVLKETNAFALHIVDEKDLAGLPQSQIEQAALTAKERNVEGWIFTLHAPSYVPFMTYADSRELRKKMYLAYNTRCAIAENETCNFEIVKKLVNLRQKIAQLLGHKNYAEYVLKRRMAENQENVEGLLSSLIESYKEKAVAEIEMVKQKARTMMGEDFEMMPWDFSYYSHKLQLEKYDLDMELLRPYLELSKVIDGVFGLATTLYGITFRKNGNIPVYHPDVSAYEVIDKNGEFLAVLYTDFYPRTGKQGGAWMTNYKEQFVTEQGEDSRPHVSITMNFSKPTLDKPALLTLSEVETFLHEFGHALHSIFSEVNYSSLSGTNVYWDFVELPSQIMENYVTEKDFLYTFAKHYDTGELIPEVYIDRIKKSRNYNVAYACMRQVSFGLLDMAYYTLEHPLDEDIKNFEKNAWGVATLLPSVDECCMTVQFGHIMSGGYSAGYYSYKWAEVLDADAFSKFKEKGIFNRENAEDFRKNILSKGGTENPMTLFVKFRGRKPSIEALLERNGIENGRK
ncbi:MAG: M3 family metallopeptidase [Bacteroidaceae bacterium]|nr:M3 family metallopeptidase [Bacteroidaceae bacterium]